MKLDWNQIALAAGSAANKLRSYYVFDEINSTNNWDEWSGNEKLLPAVCLAEQQINGRGRNGKLWVSRPGENIYLTLVWPFGRGKESGLTGLSLAIGIAIAKLLNGYGIKAKIKWPNDILVEQAKLAGILIETKIKRRGEIIAMLGVGVNYALDEASHGHISCAATDFLSHCKTQTAPDRDRLIGGLIRELVQACELYEQQGYSAFAAYWDEYDICAGKIVSVQDETGVWQAEVVGLASDCGLRLIRDDIETVVYAADVSIKVD